MRQSNALACLPITLVALVFSSLLNVFSGTAHSAVRTKTDSKSLVLAEGQTSTCNDYLVRIGNDSLEGIAADLGLTSTVIDRALADFRSIGWSNSDEAPLQLERALQYMSLVQSRTVAAATASALTQHGYDTKQSIKNAISAISLGGLRPAEKLRMVNDFFRSVDQVVGRGSPLDDFVRFSLSQRAAKIRIPEDELQTFANQWITAADKEPNTLKLALYLSIMADPDAFAIQVQRMLPRRKFLLFGPRLSFSIPPRQANSSAPLKSPIDYQFEEFTKRLFLAQYKSRDLLIGEIIAVIEQAFLFGQAPEYRDIALVEYIRRFCLSANLSGDELIQIQSRLIVSRAVGAILDEPGSRSTEGLSFLRFRQLLNSILADRWSNDSAIEKQLDVRTRRNLAPDDSVVFNQETRRMALLRFLELSRQLSNQSQRLPIYRRFLDTLIKQDPRSGEELVMITSFIFEYGIFESDLTIQIIEAIRQKTFELKVDQPILNRVRAIIRQRIESEKPNRHPRTVYEMLYDDFEKWSDREFMI